MITLRENGAAEKVDGSNLILNVGDATQGVIDLGHEFGNESLETSFSFDVKKADFLFGTHTHLDHCGKILPAYKAGLSCPMYFSYGSADVFTQIQLPQQANKFFMHNKRAGDLRKRGINIPFKKELWNYGDLKFIRDNLIRYYQEPEEGKKVQLGYPYQTPFEVINNEDTKISAAFYNAGHMLGSSQIRLDIEYQGKKTVLLTAFDLGRTDYKIRGHPIADTPIVQFPYTNFPKDIDAVVIEATYGNKTHKPFEESEKILEESINDTARRNGKIIIPAFSMHRTQIIQYLIHKLDAEGKIPANMHFFITSPGADSYGKLLLKHNLELDEHARKNYIDKKNNFLYFDRLTHHNKVAETIELLARGNSANPYGILASSGMCQEGRIERILHQELADPKNLVLLTGFQSPGTRGYLLEHGETKIPFYNEIITRQAEVRKMGGLSGHADIEELVAHVKNLYDPKQDKKKPFKVFIKHGEKDSCWAVRERLIKEGYNPSEVIVMKRGEVYNL